MGGDAAPLAGIKVVEIAGLAPAPFAGMVLADFGADVVRVDRSSDKGKIAPNMDTLARGKRSIAINLKSPEGKEVFKTLIAKSDVLVEPFRPGVMERLGLGPEVLCELNPKLIYARMTGFGQGGEGKVEKAAGHDINYIAVSGILSQLRRAGDTPQPPINLLGDFAGGGLMCALGILLAIIERSRSGKGQVIDAAMVDGASYVSQFIYRGVELGQIKNSLDGVGTNLLDGGAHFYGTFACKDGKHFSVGAIEPQFYKLLLEGLGLDPKRDNLPHQMDQSQWPAMKTRFAEIFKTKTRDEWAAIFDGTDACAFPILDIAEARAYSHNQKRGTYVQSGDSSSLYEPRPAPVLMRTPGLTGGKTPEPGAHTEEVLREFGVDQAKISELVDKKIVAKL